MYLLFSLMLQIRITILFRSTLESVGPTFIFSVPLSFSISMTKCSDSVLQYWLISLCMSEIFFLTIPETFCLCYCRIARTTWLTQNQTGLAVTLRTGDLTSACRFSQSWHMSVTSRRCCSSASAYSGRRSSGKCCLMS